jgi:hypothetical protein
MAARLESLEYETRLDEVALSSPARLRVFMEHHVFAVWDFMSLLKWLQNAIAPASVPWRPPVNPAAARLINEIVLAEESDATEGADAGLPSHESHFATYLRAMREVGADTGPIHHFLDVIEQHDLRSALNWARIPEPSRRFMRTTFGVIAEGRPHSVASAFAHGRERLLPAHFAGLLNQLPFASIKAPTFTHYLSRHVDLDDGEHGPAAEMLVAELCGNNARRREEAEATRGRVIQARREFLREILQAMDLAEQAGAPERIESWKILHVATDSAQGCMPSTS